ncbi:hypothetical protein N7530_012723 [Penicillium desertorum]|uniref:Uncharacterized protein n=1 Tax=Penicillium desertorum TaxID=1303715 RepID=A0A9W9WDW8_9EURO|nr:hypothetical protein N7530_012723 [Penicillium desertorum]
MPPGVVPEPMFKSDNLQPQVQNGKSNLDSAKIHQCRADGITRSSGIGPTPESKTPLPVTLQKAEPQAQSGRIGPDIPQNIQYQVDGTPSFRVISIETQSAGDKLEADFADSVYIEWQIWSLQGHPIATKRVLSWRDSEAPVKISANFPQCIPYMIRAQFNKPNQIDTSLSLVLNHQDGHAK